MIYETEIKHAHLYRIKRLFYSSTVHVLLFEMRSTLGPRHGDSFPEGMTILQRG